MKGKKYTFYLILVFVSMAAFGHAQKLQFSFARNITNYQLINTSGQTVDYLKPGSGMVFKAGVHRPFLDSISLQLRSPEKALRYTQHPGLGKILSLLTYSASLSLQQLNAVGDIQQIPLRYDTDYAGLELGLGLYIPIKNIFSIHVRGLVSANKMLHGSQMTGTSYYMLKGNAQFDDLKLFKGYQVDVSTRINSTTDFVFGYSSQSTISPSIADTGKLDLSTDVFSLGLSFKFSK